MVLRACTRCLYPVHGAPKQGLRCARMYAYTCGVTETTRKRAVNTVGVLVPTKVIERRVELGLLQKELAARAGISPQHLADIESGRRYGSPPVRLAIAKALRTSLSELTGAA